MHPLAVLFVIHAEGASAAQFSPDSQQVVFVSSTPAGTQPTPDALQLRSGPHVERWTIASRTFADSPEIRGFSCATEELSPDGTTLACNDPSGNLRIIEVASRGVIFEKKQFVRLIPTYDRYDTPTGQLIGDLGRALIDFSPDSRYLIAYPSGGKGSPVVWDISGRRRVALTGKLKAFAHVGTFIAPHHVLLPQPALNSKHGVVNAELLAFPAKDVIARFKVPAGRLFPSADPYFVLIRPFGRGGFWSPSPGRSAAADLRTGQVIISNTPAIDVLGGYYVAEPFPGVVGLYERGKGLQAYLALHSRLVN